jgi:hypothetical protein
MIERIHQHIVEELRTNTKTDTTFVLTAIVLNIAALGTNAAIAAKSSESLGIIVMAIFAGFILVVNFVAEIGLIKGRQTRTKLLTGLIRMYKDHNVDGYYDSSLLQAYKTRYDLCMLIVLVTGLIAIIVPFLMVAI